MTNRHNGYLPGLAGWTVAEHARYYSQHWGFGAFFEAKVAAGMAGFLRRLEDPGNHLWSASDEDGFVATLTLDGGDAENGLAHLRWFIVCDRARGTGVGRSMLDTALEQAIKDGARGVYLTTFAGLEAARHLYEAVGFVLINEQSDTTWGPEVMEQRFEVVF